MDQPDDPVPKYTPAAGPSSGPPSGDVITAADNHEGNSTIDPKQPDEVQQDDQDQDFYARVAGNDALPLPILASPPGRLYGRREQDENQQLIRDIVESLFLSVRCSRNELVGDFVSRGLVSPDVKDCHGHTPLLVAVHRRDLPMVRTLLGLGALVDGLARSPEAGEYGRSDYKEADHPKRTPLMLAARIGFLAGVKCLMEEHGADDAIVAPDGAIALRLAAEAGHREIVEYLPRRRAGALLRWRKAHGREMRVVWRALKKIGRFVLVFVWTIPRFFLYEVPRRTAKGIWRRRHDIARGLKKIPRKIGRAAKRVANGVVRLVKAFPDYLVRLAKTVTRFVKAIPVAARIVWNYIYRTAAKVGGAVWELAKSVASLLHTVIVAVVTFFQTITLKDIRNGLVYVLRGLFVALPKALFSFVKNFGQVSYDVLKATLGGLGKAFWWLCRAVLWLLAYIPAKLWQCMEAIGRLAKRGAHECFVVFNPKRM
jgi:hypothetical protein